MTIIPTLIQFAYFVLIGLRRAKYLSQSLCYFIKILQKDCADAESMQVILQDFKNSRLNCLTIKNNDCCPDTYN